MFIIFCRKWPLSISLRYAMLVAVDRGLPAANIIIANLPTFTNKGHLFMNHSFQHTMNYVIERDIDLAESLVESFCSLLAKSNSVNASNALAASVHNRIITILVNKYVCADDFYIINRFIL